MLSEKLMLPVEDSARKRQEIACRRLKTACKLLDAAGIRLDTAVKELILLAKC